MADETQGKAPEAGAPAPQSGGPRGGPGPAADRADGTSRRRSRRPRQVLSPQEGVQVLHREDRRHSLSRCSSAARVCGRARQDRAPPFDRRVHHAPAPANPRHQAGPEHCPAAICDPPLGSGAALRRAFVRKVGDRHHISCAQTAAFVICANLHRRATILQRPL